MFKIPKKRTTDFKEIEAAIRGMNGLSELKSFYSEYLNAYRTLDADFHFSECFDEDFVLDQLVESSKRRDRDLFGIPFGVKDTFNTIKLPTTMGSAIWKGFKAGNNARIVDEISDRGGTIFSKTTTAEFAVHYIQAGRTINPHGIDRITGTSSSGSAVAVASGALPIALGSQTAGSIVRPASFCGVFGYKPSFGAIDRTGILKTTDTLDTIGFLGSDIYGLKKTFTTVFQKEPENYHFARNYTNSYNAFKLKRKLRIGIITDQFSGYQAYEDYVKKDFSLFIEKLDREFLDVESVDGVDFINDVHPLHEQIYCKSLSYYFESEFSHGGEMSDIMREMIRRGHEVSAVEYINATRKQPLYRKRFDEIFKSYDFILTPSTASAAPLIGQPERADSCLIWTFLGYPVLSLPIFWSEELNLPFGLQVIGPKFADFGLLDFGESLLNLG